MSKIAIFNLSGEAAGEKEIADGLLETKRGGQAVLDVVTAYRAGLRAGTASTKTRDEVSGGGRKPYKQKGTGRARQGSIRSPILRGGGVVFGPHPRDYSKKVNKKLAALAFRRALSEKLAGGAVSVAEGLEGIEAKTKAVASLLKKVAKGRATLFVTGVANKNLNLAARNVPKVEVTTAAQANTYQVFRYPVIVADAAGLAGLQARLSEGVEK
ncbi:MAG TPA: 50S ribosomal protein L4 [Verrucomicrobia bacterium]|nr:50S ribosomal protein L4 [Verrucomicrobiota bacterium]